MDSGKKNNVMSLVLRTGNKYSNVGGGSTYLAHYMLDLCPK